MSSVSRCQSLCFPNSLRSILPASLRLLNHLLHRVEEALAAEVKQAEASIAEEHKRIELFRKAARSKEISAKNDIAVSENQLRLARIECERAAPLRPTGAVSDHEYELRIEQFHQAELVLDQKRRDYELQQLVAVEAEKGRFFSGIDIKANLPALQENLAHKRTEVEQIRTQVVDLEDLIDRTKVIARSAGIVHALNRMPGDRVSEGEYVLAVESGEAANIVARFTVDDAKYLHCGAEVKVIGHARNQILRGKVIAIGHTGLTSLGVVAPDQETKDLDVPVKIRLENPGSTLIVGEGVDVKVPRSWSLAAFLEKLF